MLPGKVIFIVAIIMQIIIRYPYRGRTKANDVDQQERILLLILTIGGLILPLIYIFTNWLAFADYNTSLWLVAIGVVLMLLGLWLFWRSHADLGHNWSPSLTIHEEHTLVTEGVYQRIRHPMYSSSWLMMTAQALLLSNWLAGLGGLVTFALMYFLRVSKEEEMMLKEFGEQYQEYMSKTGRVFPKL